MNYVSKKTLNRLLSIYVYTAQTGGGGVSSAYSLLVLLAWKGNKRPFFCNQDIFSEERGDLNEYNIELKVYYYEDLLSVLMEL